MLALGMEHFSSLVIAVSSTIATHVKLGDRPMDHPSSNPKSSAII
jgi:hypothetical protein